MKLGGSWWVRLRPRYGSSSHLVGQGGRNLRTPADSLVATWDAGPSGVAGLPSWARPRGRRIVSHQPSRELDSFDARTKAGGQEAAID